MDFENKYGTLNMQIALLVLLKELDAFFEKNSIEYSLDSGSLLGAVRHNGFIPWDDDIDIIVDRPNFEKIQKLSFKETNMIHERYLWLDKIKFSPLFLDNQNCNEEATIDIFVLDAIPDNKILQNFRNIVVKFMQGMMKPKPVYSRFSVKNKILSFVAYNFGKLFSEEEKYQLYHIFTSQYRNKKTKYSTCYFYPYKWIGCIFNIDVLKDKTKHRFEDAEFPIIKNYDSYLTEVYGDWRTPPEESERKPIHIKYF